MSSLAPFSDLLAKMPHKPSGRQSASGVGLVPILIFAVVGLGLSAITAYLVVKGYSLIVLGLILVFPTIIVLYKRPFLAVLIWLLMAPFLMTTESTTTRTIYWMIHRALPPVTVGIILLSSLLRIHPRRLPKLSWVEFAMAGYLAVSLVSILTLNNDPQATTFLFYDRVVSPMCLYLIVRLSAPTEQDFQQMMPVLFFVAVSQSLIGLTSWFAPQVLPSEWLTKEGQRATGSLVNATIFTAALTFSGVLLFQAAANRKPGLIRTLYLFAFLLSSFCVFISFSRGSWLAGVLVTVGLICLYPKLMFRLGLVAVPLMIILLAGPLAGEVRYANERLFSEEAQVSAASRLPVAMAAFSMFEAKPAFGWGYENFDRYDRQFYRRVGNFNSDSKDHASHNFFLSLSAEQGLVGFLLFLAPVIGCLILTLKILPSMPKQGFWSRKLLIVLWLIMLNYLIQYNFMNLMVVFGTGLWWLTLGLIAQVVYAHQAARKTVAEGAASTAWKSGERQPALRGAK